jgi:hypothetical protein
MPVSLYTSTISRTPSQLWVNRSLAGFGERDTMLSISTAGGGGSGCFLNGFHDQWLQPHNVSRASGASSVGDRRRRTDCVAHDDRPCWRMSASMPKGAGGNVSGCGGEWQKRAGLLRAPHLGYVLAVSERIQGAARALR